MGGKKTTKQPNPCTPMPTLSTVSVPVQGSTSRPSLPLGNIGAMTTWVLESVKCWVRRHCGLVTEIRQTCLFQSCCFRRAYCTTSNLIAAFQVLIRQTNTRCQPDPCGLAANRDDEATCTSPVSIVPGKVHAVRLRLRLIT